MKISKKLLSFFILLLSVFVVIGCSETTTNITNKTTASPTTESTTVITDETSTSVTTEITTETTTISTLQTTEEPTTFSSTTESVILTYTGIELISNSKIFYQLNESFDKSSLDLIAHLSDGSTESANPEDITIRSFSSTSAGKITVFIIYKKFLVETDIYVLADYAFEIDMPYYKSAINLRGQNLKVALNNILNDGFINLLYGDARYILDEADQDPNNPNNLILVYLGTSVDSSWDGGATWNREHVWPQSRLGVYVGYDEDDFPSKATDLHNLKPADPDENAFRSNDYFDWVKTSNTYEPRDEVKGDIARILFYMATMYFDLSLNDDPASISAYKSMGNLSTLLEWNEIDPVDDFERNRNEVIYSYQKNRNPFIDYPEFADLIWGDLAN
jgi:endonuclease I